VVAEVDEAPSVAHDVRADDAVVETPEQQPTAPALTESGRAYNDPREIRKRQLEAKRQAEQQKSEPQAAPEEPADTTVIDTPQAAQSANATGDDNHPDTHVLAQQFEELQDESPSKPVHDASGADTQHPAVNVVEQQEDTLKRADVEATEVMPEPTDVPGHPDTNVIAQQFDEAADVASKSKQPQDGTGAEGHPDTNVLDQQQEEEPKK
jgi:ribonuclease E